MRRNRLWTGLASIFSFLLVLCILGCQAMFHYSSTVNQILGISTSIVQNPEGTDQSNLTYYESDFGELNEENLQKVIKATYDESVQEEAEGAVLLKNDDNALPLGDDEKSVTLFGHAVVQPLYRSSAAGSKVILQNMVLIWQRHFKMKDLRLIAHFMMPTAIVLLREKQAE